jgi:hypothetical protein
VNPQFSEGAIKEKVSEESMTKTSATLVVCIAIPFKTANNSVGLLRVGIITEITTL